MVLKDKKITRSYIERVIRLKTMLEIIYLGPL